LCAKNMLEPSLQPHVASSGSTVSRVKLNLWITRYATTHCPIRFLYRK